MTIAFDLMRLELDEEVESLNSEGATAFRESEYENARALSERGVALQGFLEKVETLATEWRENFAANFPEMRETESGEMPHRQILSASKSPRTLLLVRFPDGTTIYEQKASDTFAASLEKIGLNRVAKLGMKVNKEDLVSREPSKIYNDTNRAGYFVKTHSSTKSKKRQLDEISGKLKVGLQVRIVDG